MPGIRKPAAGAEQPPRKRRRPEPTAAQRALGLLTRREHSRKELAQKLAGKGLEQADVDAAVDLMRREGWQDDARFAASLAQWRANSGYGPLRIRAELRTHGIGPELVSAALAALAEVGEGDWEASAMSLLRRRYGAGPLDLAVQRKAAGYLVRRGFDAQTVRSACNVGIDDT